MPRRKETFPCPACGAEVPVGAVSCRACGADEGTGWGESPVEEAQELDLPETHLDDDRYDEFVREDLEGDSTEPTPPSAWGLFLVVLGVLAVAALLALLTGTKK